MRRKDKQLTAPEQIKAVIEKSVVCRLGMCEGNRPYVVPLCFGFRNNCLYFHCAKEGKKIEILKSNNNVCFEFDVDQEVVTSNDACTFGMKYRSVIGCGKAYFINDDSEKQKALDIIVRQYSDIAFSYSEAFFKNVLVIKVEVESIAGKQSGI